MRKSHEYCLGNCRLRFSFYFSLGIRGALRVSEGAAMAPENQGNKGE